jgi:hypothetical protein
MLLGQRKCLEIMFLLQFGASEQLPPIISNVISTSNTKRQMCFKSMNEARYLHPVEKKIVRDRMNYLITKFYLTCSADESRHMVAIPSVFRTHIHLNF